MHPNIAPESQTAIPIHALRPDEVDAFLAARPGGLDALAGAHDFRGQAGRVLLAPGPDGRVERVLFGLGADSGARVYGWLSMRLPAGDYRLATPPPREDAQGALESFLTGAYVFDRYKRRDARLARLVPPPSSDPVEAGRVARAIALGRDLVNTPPNDMGPDALEAQARAVAEETGAEVECIAGEDLLVQNYPLIHAVGKASAQAPRLLILRAPATGGPKLALVGKGVTFDTGGLNMKPSSGMALMKKDMGGAACTLALFRLLVESGLKAQISLYLPIVENAVSGSAFRPSDIVMSRKGLSVEIDNTDAEGRLILADALTRASEDGAELVIDMATLTGAARVALGPDLPPFYTPDASLAADIEAAARQTGDPVWRMPLWGDYLDDLDSPVADMKNSGSAFAGSITAALFLQKFVSAPLWVHFDVYCWNPKDKSGRPAGGEAHAVRALNAMLKKRFGTRQA